MALVVKTKWRKGGPRTLEERAGVVGFNIWKIAFETFKHMEGEGFRFATDRQTAEVLTELIAFQVQAADRMVYGRLAEDERARFINALGRHLAHTMENNLLDLLGPGEYRSPFIAALNARARDYAECDYRAEGPGYAFLRLLGAKVSEAMAATDNKWVIEHVMEIEAPPMIKHLKRTVGEVLGVKTG
jgi:hypothetical protein